jgi:hypothetical protein
MSKSNKNILSIDPGLQSMGYAYFKPGDPHPHTVGLITNGYNVTDDNWPERVTAQVMNLWHDLSFIHNVECLSVYSEMPEFFNSVGGRAAVGSNHLQRLVFLVGAMHNQFQSHGVPFTLVPVRRWKGQLPKEVVEQRIIKLLGKDGCVDFKKDIWDAVGIGLWVQGLL